MNREKFQLQQYSIDAIIGNAQDKWCAGVGLEYNFTTAAGRTVFIL